MDTVVLKFGGSSLSDDKKLNIVSDKIIDFKNNFKNVIVVVSAQGKTTNKLINEALNISKMPNERELDSLLSVGEQISATKLSILLNEKGYNSISLTGWQAGIKTNNVFQNAKIEEIYTKRITDELAFDKIVIVCGFQGFDDFNNITTLGRGGSDTSAVSLAYALDADKCFIFSDVDGVYSADPKIVTSSEKLEKISFDEMQEISDAGAKVLHNRCINVGRQHNLDIIAASTFSDNNGTSIVKTVESSFVKSIVKNDNLTRFTLYKEGSFDRKETYMIYSELLHNNIFLERFRSLIDIEFYVKREDINKVVKILDLFGYNYTISKFVKLSVIGNGIMSDNKYLNIIVDILKENRIEIIDVYVSSIKIELVINEIPDEVIRFLHDTLIVNKK